MPLCFMCLAASKSSVPEGRRDRSQARSAWNTDIPKEPSRRARCDSCRSAHRVDDWRVGVRKFLELAAPENGSDRTLRDGSLEVALSRHFVPGYDRVVPPGQLDSMCLAASESSCPGGEYMLTLTDFLIPVSGTIHFVICSFGR
jgi:hypothetical protein